MLLKFNFVQTPSALATSGEGEEEGEGLGGFGRGGNQQQVLSLFHRLPRFPFTRDANCAIFPFFGSHLQDCRSFHHRLIVPTFSDEAFRLTISMMAVVLMGGGEEGLSDL